MEQRCTRCGEKRKNHHFMRSGVVTTSLPCTPEGGFTTEPQKTTKDEIITVLEANKILEKEDEPHRRSKETT